MSHLQWLEEIGEDKGGVLVGEAVVEVEVDEEEMEMEMEVMEILVIVGEIEVVRGDSVHVE